MGVVTPLRLMCPAAVIYAVGTTVGSVYLAKGRPRLLFMVSLALTLSFTAAVVGGAAFGLEFVAAGVSLAALGGYGLGFVFVLKLLRIGWRDFARTFTTPALAAAAVVGWSLAFRWGVMVPDVGTRFIVAAVGSALAYAGVIASARLPELNEVKAFVVQRLHTRPSFVRI